MKIEQVEKRHGYSLVEMNGMSWRKPKEESSVPSKVAELQRISAIIKRLLLIDLRSTGPLVTIFDREDFLFMVDLKNDDADVTKYFEQRLLDLEITMPRTSVFENSLLAKIREWLNVYKALITTDGKLNKVPQDAQVDVAMYHNTLICLGLGDLVEEGGIALNEGELQQSRTNILSELSNRRRVRQKKEKAEKGEKSKEKKVKPSNPKRTK